MDVAYANTQAMPEVEVVIFPATKSPKELRKKKGKLRVAAYCRVSTDDEEPVSYTHLFQQMIFGNILEL